MKGLKYFSVLILLIAGFLSAYFVKCQLDICLIKDFSLDRFPPLNLLQNRNPFHIIHDPQANVDLFSNKYIFVSGLGRWNDLWMREKDGVTLDAGPDGADHSPNLAITSRSQKDWALGHKRLIEVKPGDSFSFSGRVKTSSEQAIGSLSVALYDADRQVKQWDYAIESVSRADHWRKIERQLVVPSGIRYIRFQLTGKGVGKVWFDKITFKKQ